MPRKLLNSELSRLSAEEFKQADKLPLVLVLDNIRSQHNIGAAFRTADAFRIEKIYLCGISSPPPSAEIHKAALGAEDTVAWHYEKETTHVIDKLCEEGYCPVAIEQVEGSILLHDFQPQKGKKYALIFGNEVKGVQQQVVDRCGISLEIPQQGTKHSLNVSVSIGVVLWDIVSKLR
ncbi:MAG: TrmH family RNA methyltransferase [Prevotellaceae bacterium]|jgi:tRNA G18 (ribose-2'-O)-methylase SpoU|nr:TrmH family RNA methyltransferase [Prevotellaceae bacterium]